MWVCSHHQDIEVNSKGKGCYKCQKDRDNYLEKKRARRRKNEDQEEEEDTY